MTKRILAVCLALCVLLGAGAFAESHRDEDSGVILAIGGGYAYALAADGTLYAFGMNQYGQLGTGRKGGDTPVLRAILNKEEKALKLDYTGLVDIVAGCDYSYLVYAGGDLYGTGRNRHGQMLPGNGFDLMAHKKLTILPDETITQLSTGFGQTLALTDKGEVYAFGRNDYGQVGAGSQSNVFVNAPAKLPLADIVSVEAGGTFSMALGADGTVYAWGNNEYGQILGQKGKKVAKPVALPLGGIKVKKLAGGGYWAAVLDENGDVYAWGTNDLLQCGVDTGGKSVRTPTRVPLPMRVTDISVYSAQALVMLEDGSLWSWGSRYFAKSAEGLRAQQRFGHLLPAEVMAAGEAKLFVCGQGLLVMKQDGELFACGHRRTGQLVKVEGVDQMLFISTGINLLTGETWDKPR